MAKKTRGGGKTRFKVGAKTRTPRVGGRARAAVGNNMRNVGRPMSVVRSKAKAGRFTKGIPQAARESAEMSAAAGSSNEG